MIFYQQGQRAAFRKLGMSPALSHALVGGALGAGAGYGFSSDDHKLRGTLVGGALGATLGGVAGDHRKIPEVTTASAPAAVKAPALAAAAPEVVHAAAPAAAVAADAARETFTPEEFSPLFMNHHKFVESHKRPGGNPEIVSSWKKVLNAAEDAPDTFPAMMNEHQQHLAAIADSGVHDNWRLLNAKNPPKG